jgi:hypothetical protein
MNARGYHIFMKPEDERRFLLLDDIPEDRLKYQKEQDCLAKLILSLWSEDAAFSLRECISSFDDTRLVWADEMTTHFFRFRFDQFLEDAAKKVVLICPHLLEKGLAGSHAKCDWERSNIIMEQH